MIIPKTKINTAPLAEECMSIGLSELEKTAEKIIIPSVEEVRLSAQRFIEEYEKAEQQYAKWTSENRVSVRQRNVIMLLSGARAAFYEFQNKVNAFFGQTVKVIYTYMDPVSGQITLSALDNTASHLSINEDRKYVEYNLRKLNNILTVEDYDSKLLDAAQQSIYARWQVAKMKTGKSRFLPILWREDNGEWAGASINNLGTISEAYVNFYINRYKGFKNSLENNIAIFILHPEYGAVAVDNMSGFLIGDVNYGKLQLAVKKESASPMNMKKVYDITKSLLSANTFHPDALYKKFVIEEREKARRNQVNQNLAQYSESTIQSILQELKI